VEERRLGVDGPFFVLVLKSAGAIKERDLKVHLCEDQNGTSPGREGLVGHVPVVESGSVDALHVAVGVLRRLQGEVDLVKRIVLSRLGTKPPDLRTELLLLVPLVVLIVLVVHAERRPDKFRLAALG